MKKTIIIYILITTAAFAQSAGETGLSFLKHGFGARNVALGDLGVASANDISALYYNPALLLANEVPQLTFSHNSLFQDLSSEMFGAKFYAFGFPFAIGINTTSVDGIEVRTKPGDVEAKINANYFYASLASAYSLTEKLFVGASLKYIYENIYSDDAKGYAVDFGVAYKSIINNLDLGASVKNIGSMNALRNTSTELPSEFSLGAAYNYEINNFAFSGLVGMSKYFKENDSHLSLGIESNYNKFLSLRVGYLTAYDSKGLSAGFGVVWKNFNLDYAYVPVKYGLGDSNILTLTYSFN